MTIDAWACDRHPRPSGALDRQGPLAVLRFFLAFLLVMAVGAARAGEGLPYRIHVLSLPPEGSAAPGLHLARPKIVGGALAAEGAWPMTVYLTLYFSATSAGACGGTVIAPYVILTAAHCVANDDGSLAIIAGSATVATNDSASTQTVSASQVAIHASYRGAVGGSDIALLRLSEPLTVDTVSLSTTSDDATLTANGATSTAVGWGTTSEGGSVSQFLRQVDIPIVSNTT
ncbi:MAG: trypsin-like serine protease [Alphaproteobacteria bacterium]|nr:trypsin-like serine protease [Alphaproteobacteria bacterium]